MTKKSLKKFLINLAFVLVIIIICFIILEVGLRIAFDLDPASIRPDKTKLYSLYPNIDTYLDFPILGIESVHFTTNSHGFNSPSWFEKDKTHLLMIGDSYVEASAYGEESFTRILQNNLGEGTNVVAAGVSSYALDNQFKLYEELAQCSNEHDISRLYLFHFLNDDWDSYRNDIFIMENDTLVDNTPVEISLIKRSVMFTSKYSITIQVLSKIVMGNQFLMKIASIFGVSNQGDKFDYFLVQRGEIPSFMFSEDLEFEETRNDVYKKTELYFQMFKDKSEEHGIEFVVVLIPLREEIFPEDLEKFHYTYGEDLNPELINDNVENILNKLDITYISLKDEVKSRNGNGELFFDFEQDFHMSIDGQYFLAEILEENINGQE